ncbi:unnamed protein product [Caretta caretta]
MVHELEAEVETLCAETERPKHAGTLNPGSKDKTACCMCPQAAKGFFSTEAGEISGNTLAANYSNILSLLASLSRIIQLPCTDWRLQASIHLSQTSRVTLDKSCHCSMPQLPHQWNVNNNARPYRRGLITCFQMS